MSDNPNREKKNEAIAFVTGTFGHGRGGHFWDLVTVAEAVSSSKDVIIFNVSGHNSPVLDETHINVINIRGGFFYSIFMLKKYVADFNVTSIFSFDIRVAFFPSLISNLLRIPFIFVKPGGPNPSKSYPKVSDLILYSKENYEYFREDVAYNNTNLYLLPNRSVNVCTDWLLVNEIKAKLNLRFFKFVQVIRITPEYCQNLTQSINLIKRLNKSSENKVGLIIIGVIQDVDVYEKIKKEAEGFPVYIITENKFTECASKLLEVGDAVIGNGRSVMEGASLGLPILVSAQNAPHPVLLDRYNFDKAFSVNFSPRFEVESPEEAKHFDNVNLLVNNVEYLNETKKHSKKCFDVHFNVTSIVGEYLTIAKKTKHRYLPLKTIFGLFKVYVVSTIRSRISK